MGKVYVLCLKPQNLKVTKFDGFSVLVFFFQPSNKCQQAFLLTIFYNISENISKGIEIRGDKIKTVLVLGDPEIL